MRSDWAKRLAALEAQSGTTVTLTLADGTLYRIPSKRVYRAACDAAMGSKSPDALAVLRAIDSTGEKGMIELVQSYCDGPMCEAAARS